MIVLEDCHEYKVIKAIPNIKEAKIAALVGEIGGGVQFKLIDMLNNKVGYLEEVGSDDSG